jgi:plastocyanin
VRRSLFFSASLLLITALAAACGGDAPSNETTSDGDDSSNVAETGSPDDDMSSDDGDTGHHEEASPVAPGARRIEVEASSFRFDPSDIRVAAGEDIAIVLTSDDVLHDFTIDELDAHVSADEGETAEGGFHAGEPGRYAFYCSVEGHREGGMEGTLVVE